MAYGLWPSLICASAAGPVTLGNIEAVTNAPAHTIPPCKTVFLDAGGVLVWPNWTWIADVLQDQGISVDANQLAAADPFVRQQFDLGGYRPGPREGLGEWKFFDMVLSRIGIAPCAATEAAMSILREYHRTENLWEYVPEFVPPALLQLRKLGLQLVVVSNANGTLRKSFDRLGLSSMVDLMIDSSEVGLQKPDPRLFDLALQRSGADRATTIHVGDIYHIDVLGARAAGLTAVLVDQANLYSEVDCLRIRSIAELPLLIRANT